HTYKRGGTYTVTVTSYQSDGLSTSKSVRVRVEGEEEEEEETGTINIYVEDIYGNELPEAEIYLDGNYQGETSDSGFFQIVDVSEGYHMVTAKKSGFDEDSKEVYLGAGKRAKVELTLDGPPWGTIKVYVQDDDEHDLPGVAVYLDSDHKGETDEEGFLRIEYVPEGNHTITVSKSGYEEDSEEVYVEAWKIVREYFYLTLEEEESGTIKIYVKDDYGNKLKSASVYLDGKYRGKTDINGYFEINNIEEGKYIVKASREEYKDDSIYIYLKDGDTVYLTLENKYFYFAKKYLKADSSLSVYIKDIDKKTGKVIIDGKDNQNSAVPLTFEWGDDSPNSYGKFPQEHIYADLSKNYVLRVVAHYPRGKINSEEVLVYFTKLTINEKEKISLPDSISVIIPDHTITLKERDPEKENRPKNYKIQDLSYFDDDNFKYIDRETVEYVLTLAALIQKNFVNDNIILIDEEFPQVILLEPGKNGAHSIWYTDPICVAIGENFSMSTDEGIKWVVLFHELGHNFTLNTPPHYPFGGNLDGGANALYSESIARIFQIVTACELINNYEDYGLTEDIVFKIKQDTIDSMNNLYDIYKEYESFSSWGNKKNETKETFVTIAYKFFENAKKSEIGYRIAVKRMMEFFQTFDKDIKEKYSPNKNSEPAAEEFRATYMVVALSYAFSEDLRKEFRDLNFPINDEIYNQLYDRVTKPEKKLDASISMKDLASSYEPGDTLKIETYVKNTGDISHKFIVGCTIIDPYENENDIPYKTVELNSKESETVHYSYDIPSNAPDGRYQVVVSIWEKDAGGGELENRLDRDDEYFNISNEDDDECQGTTFLFLLVLLGSAGIRSRYLLFTR
ncbi:MAG: PEGA domain-containing protein, partial [Candidatus Methanofastidiosia archaeon]